MEQLIKSVILNNSYGVFEKIDIIYQILLLNDRAYLMTTIENNFINNEVCKTCVKNIMFACMDVCCKCKSFDNEIVIKLIQYDVGNENFEKVYEEIQKTHECLYSWYNNHFSNKVAYNDIIEPFDEYETIDYNNGECKIVKKIVDQRISIINFFFKYFNDNFDFTIDYYLE